MKDLCNKSLEELESLREDVKNYEFFDHIDKAIKYKNRLSKQYIIDMNIGFYPIEHFTVTDSLLYNLGRNRQLSFGSIGTPNEMLYITEHGNDYRKIDELICLHNYDYDGYMTMDKLNLLLSYFKTNNK